MNSAISFPVFSPFDSSFGYGGLSPVDCLLTFSCLLSSFSVALSFSFFSVFLSLFLFLSLFIPMVSEPYVVYFSCGFFWCTHTVCVYVDQSINKINRLLHHGLLHSAIHLLIVTPYIILLTLLFFLSVSPSPPLSFRPRTLARSSFSVYHLYGLRIAFHLSVRS